MQNGTYELQIAQDWFAAPPPRWAASLGLAGSCLS